MTKTNDLPSLASSAIIGSISISVWTARKKAKDLEQDIQASKGSSKRAASVYKNLFAECQQLDAIISYGAESRLWFNKSTLPWDDNGGRLIPTALYLDLSSEASSREGKFHKLVDTFCDQYDNETSKQAFSRGMMFDRNEYPLVAEVRSKFAFRLNVAPIPLSGDFRVDIGGETIKAMAEQYDALSAARIAGAMAEPWARLRTHIEHVRDRMDAVLKFDPSDATDEVRGEDGNGNATLKIVRRRRPKLYESLLDNGLELCDMLGALNVMNDPRLEEARNELKGSLIHLDMGSLKESVDMQKSTKKKMDDMMDKFF